jgi:hypothetical protein
MTACNCLHSLLHVTRIVRLYVSRFTRNYTKMPELYLVRSISYVPAQADGLLTFIDHVDYEVNTIDIDTAVSVGS